MNSKESIYTGFEFEEDGFPAFALINKDLKSMEDRSSYGYAVFIGVVPIEYNEHGHPEGEEEKYLLKIEEDIMEAIEITGETEHVGHITLTLKREIVFYTQLPDKVEEYLNAFLPAINRESSFEILEDPEWENVEGFYEMFD
jgi:hypothetical protein